MLSENVKGTRRRRPGWIEGTWIQNGTICIEDFDLEDMDHK